MRNMRCKSHSRKKESIKMNKLNHFTKILSTTMLSTLLFAVLFAGCGKDDNNGPLGGTPDTTPPTVLSTNPIDGATGVALINVTFSEPISASSINQASFTVKDPSATAVLGAVSYDASSNRASFVPSSDLASNTTFTAMIVATAKDDAGNVLASNYVWNFTTAATTSVQLPVVLSSTSNYVVIAGATITNTGATNITGDMGLSPGSAVTGFPPGIIVGTKHIADPSAAQAKLDLTIAYNDAAGRTLGPVSVAGNLGGMTLPPGLYKSTSSLAISSGDLTLDAQGNADAVWIFQMASTLTTTSGRKVILSGGAKAANIFWQVGSSATLGTTSVFKGTIMADQSITMNTGASLEGRVLARIGAVTLNGNIIVSPTPTGGTPDTTPPTVLSTNPINGATGVDLINVTFSEPMLASSISATSFTIQGPGVTAVAGAVSYDAANNRASFVPSSDLASNTYFTATITTIAADLVGNVLVSNYVWNFTTLAVATGQLPVILASAGNYVVIAGATITNTGATNITGDMGLSPGSAVTGFPPGIIVGTKHIADPSAAQAKLDLTTAYNNAKGRTVGPVSVTGNLGGMTLAPGLYKSTSSLAISSGDLTLDAQGNADAVWIFQMASTLTTTSGRKVILSGGAKAANIFWQVGSSATLGTTSVFKGTIMADQSITMNTGASLEGRVLARIGAVTLNGNTIVVPAP